MRKALSSQKNNCSGATEQSAQHSKSFHADMSELMKNMLV